MKSFFSKLMLIVAGATAIFGISVANAPASTPVSVSEITSKSALYLEHGKSISDNIGATNWHNSHASHESHASHASHASHRSGY